MDVLTLILACSLYPDDELVRVLVDAASRRNVYFVGELDTMNTYDTATTLDEAKKIVAEVRRIQGRPAIGLMGLPPSWASRFGRAPDDLFDGCTNISVGTAMLSQFEEQCRTEVASRRARSRRKRPPPSFEALRPCVLQRLGRDLGIHNFVEGANKAIAIDRQRAPERTLEAAESSPVFIDRSGESASEDLKWSNPQVFVGK